MLETNDPEEEETPSACVTAEWPDSEKLAYEKELLFYVSGHPLEPFSASSTATAPIRWANSGIPPHHRARGWSAQRSAVHLPKTEKPTALPRSLI